MDNFIEIYDNAVSAEICNYFIKLFEHQDSKGNTHIGQTGPGIKNKEWKDCTDLDLRKILLDKHHIVGNKYLDFSTKEHIKIIKFYEKKVDEKILEYFKKYPAWSYSIENPKEGPDYDKLTIKSFDEIDCGPLMHAYEPPNQGYHIWHQDWGVHGRIASQRMIVAMLYLNDVDEGGETEWFHYNLKVKPKQGRLVIWPAYFTHLHKGNPPISNKKYIVNKWGFLKYV